MDARSIIAKRVAREFTNGDVINLGIGLPTEVIKYIPQGMNIILQSENGIINMGPPPALDRVNPRIVNAGGKPTSVMPGGAFFDSAMSFAMIRGGHIAVTVLGAFQVDQDGSLANWKIPGKLSGMGGAMDLVTGAKKVIVAMEHCAKDGSPKILRKCNLPLTAKSRVNLIVTEKGVIEKRPEGLVLKELAPGISLREVMESTEAELIICDSLVEKSL
jgi:3-oxoacid CoA-transferase, B subunit